MNEIKNRSTAGLYSVMVVFLLLFFVFGSFGLRYVYGYLLLGLLLAVSALRVGLRIRLSAMKAVYLFTVIVAAVYVFLPGANQSHLTISRCIAMVVMAGFFLYMEPGERELRRSFVWMLSAALVFAAYILVVKAWPALYWENIFPLLCQTAQEFAAYIMPLGYGVTLGAATTYSIYIIAFVLIMMLSRVLVGEGFSGWNKVVWLCLAAVILFAGLMSMNRRSEVLCFMLTAAGLFVLSLDFKDKADLRQKLRGFCITALAMLVVVTILNIAGFLVRYSFSLVKIDTMEEISNGRLELWMQALGLFSEQPLFGIGWQQFMAVNTYEHEVHNTYLQWLCETGIVGFVLLLVPRVLLFYATFRHCLALRREKNSLAFVRQLNYSSLGMQVFLYGLDFLDPAFYSLKYFCFIVLALVLEEASLKMETIHTGDEKDCLRKLCLPSMKNWKIFY